MTKPARFTQAEVARALAGVKAGGERPAAVDILPDGRIRVLLGEQARAVDLDKGEPDEWEKLIARA